jgi:Asp-tRNA(Asn)/Glu-tRNA(Gln) amidotransferase A subunit family amidase
LSLTLDAIGPMSRSAVDLAILLDHIVGEDPDDPTTVFAEAAYLASVDAGGLDGRRIGVDSYSRASEDVALAFEAALDELAASGAELVEVDLPPNPANAQLRDFVQPEEAAAINSYLERYPDPPMEPRSGPPLDTHAHRTALKGREAFRKRMTDLMDEYRLDAIAYPGARTAATPIGTEPEPFDCERASVGGLPAIVMPAGFSPGGLPVAIELMGRRYDEETLIAMAAGWEAHTDHRMLPPTTPALDDSN